MNALVTVLFGHSNVVIELAGYVRPSAVNNAQRCVTTGEIIDNNPHRPDVVDIIQGNALRLHFAPDAENVFRPALDPCRNASLGELPLYHLHQFGNLLFALLPTTLKLFRDA